MSKFKKKFYVKWQFEFKIGRKIPKIKKVIFWKKNYVSFERFNKKII